MVTRGRIIIVGLGITGASCVRFFIRNGRGRDLLVVDTRTEPPGLNDLRAQFPDVQLHVGASALDFAGVEQVVVSPGVALTDPILSGRPESVRLVSDIDLFCEAASAPVIAVNELADSSVNFVVRPWVKNADYWATRWDLTERIKLGFDERGFTIPYPSRDVHLYNESAVSAES